MSYLKMQAIHDANIPSVIEVLIIALIIIGIKVTIYWIFLILKQYGRKDIK